MWLITIHYSCNTPIINIILEKCISVWWPYKLYTSYFSISKSLPSSPLNIKVFLFSQRLHSLYYIVILLLVVIVVKINNKWGVFALIHDKALCNNSERSICQTSLSNIYLYLFNIYHNLLCVTIRSGLWLD